MAIWSGWMVVTRLAVTAAAGLLIPGTIPLFAHNRAIALLGAAQTAAFTALLTLAALLLTNAIAAGFARA